MKDVGAASGMDLSAEAGCRARLGFDQNGTSSPISFSARLRSSESNAPPERTLQRHLESKRAMR